MEKNYTFMMMSILLVFSVSNLTAQVFVAANATGANDGTSWENAFSDLQDALSTAQIGDQVWVAKGTYKPGGDSPSREAFFTFDNNIELYGGFAGNETTLEERDPVANSVVLSGDQVGDDVNDDFINHKSDNCRHVMWLTDTINSATIIDGFTISNGITDPAEASGDERRGGGILCYGTPIIRNCAFTQNWGHFGGGLYPRGAVAEGIEISSCIFFNNGGSNGAGIYITQNPAGQNPFISNCSFENNIVTNRGGGVYVNASPTTIMNTQFLDNVAMDSSGGGVFIRSGADPRQMTISTCRFIGNQARWGGGITSYELGTNLTVSNCLFDGNRAENQGAALQVGFESTTEVNSCEFLNGEASSGGVVNMQNDSTDLVLNFCRMSNNNVTSRGGAISAAITDSLIGQVSTITLNNSFVNDNFASEQGGAINIQNANLTVQNSLIYNNVIDAPEGAGGGISFNASDGINLESTIMNSTLSNNVGGVGSNVGSWTDDISTSNVIMQNSILAFANVANYAIEAGTPTVTSNGGNSVSDATLINDLMGTNDAHFADPGFLDASNGDYSLTETSASIDTGVEAGAPPTDILGLPRVGAVDKGAFEFQESVATEDLETSLKQLKVYPNPVGQTINFTLDNNWNGSVNYSVKELSGKKIITNEIHKIGEIMEGRILVADLSPGVYLLNFNTTEGSVTRTFIKQ